MISHLTFGEGVLRAHLSKISLKTTKAFTHGSLRFDRDRVTFAKLPPVSLPEGFALSDQMSIRLQLVGPDGTLRKQIRTAVLMQIPLARVLQLQIPASRSLCRKPINNPAGVMLAGRGM